MHSRKVATDKHVHTMLVDAFENFDTKAKDYFFFSQIIQNFRDILNTWLLLDSESSINIISNSSIVTNIQRSPNTIILHCNTGSRQVECTTDLNGYARVWYGYKAIANIPSLSHSTREYRVAFDSIEVNCFRLMLPGREVVFNVSDNGLYFHDTVDRAIVLTNMVEENCEGFNRQ